MTTSTKKSADKATKENLIKDVTIKLETALENFKETLGEKRFRNRIKKASKNFLKGTPKKVKTKIAETKKKKSTKKVKKEK
jgi:hypothetical protein